MSARGRGGARARGSPAAAPCPARPPQATSAHTPAYTLRPAWGDEGQPNPLLSQPPRCSCVWVTRRVRPLPPTADLLCLPAGRPPCSYMHVAFVPGLTLGFTGLWRVRTALLLRRKHQCVSCLCVCSSLARHVLSCHGLVPHSAVHVCVPVSVWPCVPSRCTRTAGLTGSWSLRV